MNKQNLFIFFILFQYIIQIDGIINRTFNEISLSKNLLVNCSMIKNDVNIVQLKDFRIPLNPIQRNLNSYGSTDRNGSIIHLKIMNKKFIPLTIFSLKNLKRLEIHNTCFYPCKRSTIPSRIKCLALSLIEIKIYDTKILYLPEEISELKYLQVLILSNTGLKILPNIIGNLVQLNVLYLRENHLKSLPNTMNNLQKLKRIILSNNPNLTSIQSLNGLPELDTLDVRQCSIKNLPNNLPLLTDLYMSDNRLTSLYGIETLGYGTNNRKSFYFNRNSINFIPPQIDQIPNLFQLNLNDNKLDYLPLNICAIPTLKYLFIYNNSFNDIQKENICIQYQQSNNLF